MTRELSRLFTETAGGRDFSDRWWSRLGDEVLATAVEPFKTVCL
jgi:hypothetical protein